jgi:glycosyltransferase involved in cell wall biosynthesis
MDEKDKKKLKIMVVMPAYNAAKTVKKTFDDLPKDIIDKVILVDDCSQDNTVDVARKLGIEVISHQVNTGYGGNQKTCYQEALKRKADIVVMVHPDYQYDAALVGELVRPLVQKRFSIVFGSRIRTRQEALNGGMPLIKYLLNRLTCLVENMVLGVNLTDHFSGFRAYQKEVLKKIPYQYFSNDFVFDQQLEVAAVAAGFKIGEIHVPVRYFNEASSIGYLKGVKFMAQTYFQLFLFILHKLNIYNSMIFYHES